MEVKVPQNEGLPRERKVYEFKLSSSAWNLMWDHIRNSKRDHVHNGKRESRIAPVSGITLKRLISGFNRSFDKRYSKDIREKYNIPFIKETAYGFTYDSFDFGEKDHLYLSDGYHSIIIPEEYMRFYGSRRRPLKLKIYNLNDNEEKFKQWKETFGFFGGWESHKEVRIGNLDKITLNITKHFWGQEILTDWDRRFFGKTEGEIKYIDCPDEHYNLDLIKNIHTSYYFHLEYDNVKRGVKEYIVLRTRLKKETIDLVKKLSEVFPLQIIKTGNSVWWYEENKKEKKENLENVLVDLKCQHDKEGHVVM